MLLNRSFSHYLWGILSLIAVSFFASGAISWIASNWSLFSKTEKFGLIEGGLLLSLVIGVAVYVRETRRLKPPFQSAVWLFLSAVLIGGLLALIGQIYQTGANAWQLFAIWTVLQLPLLLALPNIANGLLYLVTLNVAAILAFNTFNGLYWAIMVSSPKSLLELLGVIALNLPLFFLVERFADKFQDHRRILANLLLAWLFVLFVISGMIEPPSRLIFWGITLAIVRYYRRYYAFLVLGFAYAVVEGNALILNMLEYSTLNEFILIPLFNLSAAILAAYQLNKRHSRLGLMLLTPLVVVIVLSLLLFLIVISDVEFEQAVAILALGTFGGAFFIRHSLLRAVSFALAIVTGTFYMLINDFAIITMWLLLALFAFTYYRENNFWLRILLTIATLIVLIAGYLPFELGLYWRGEPPILIYYFYLFLPLSCLFAFTRKKQAFQATAWGILLFLFGMEIVHAVKIDHFFAIAETEFLSYSEFFHAITTNRFRPEQISLLWAFAVLTAFSPLWLSFWLVSQRHIQGVNALILLLVSALLSIGFIAMPVVGLLFSLLLLAHINQNRLLFMVGIVGLGILLALFYYNLSISLLFKSFLLMGEAVLLGILAYCLRKPQEPIENSQVKTGKTVPIAAIATLVTTLGVANFSIWQFEDVLANGEKIVLKLVPRDPRSLMQGDYMELNYEILNDLNHLDIENEENESKHKQKQLYLLLYNHNGVDEFCDYTLAAPPTKFEQCRANIYLPIKYQYGKIKMAGQDFFFPEGKQKYFEQAEYGEFRFKEGKLLLLRLLDKELNILELQ